MKLWRRELTSQGSARGKHDGGGRAVGRPRVVSNKEERSQTLRRTVAYISRMWKLTLVSVTLVLTQLEQYRGVEVGVMEKAKNYYLALRQGKDRKWNVPLDERLAKEIKKKTCIGEIKLPKDFIVISLQKFPSAHEQSLCTSHKQDVKGIH